MRLIRNLTIALAGLAAPVHAELAGYPMQFGPWADGTRREVSITYDDCLLQKKISDFSLSGTLIAQQKIDINLGDVDITALRPIGGAVVIWMKSGHDIACEDVVGAECVLPDRMSEAIDIPQGRLAAQFSMQIETLVKQCAN